MVHAHKDMSKTVGQFRTVWMEPSVFIIRILLYKFGYEASRSPVDFYHFVSWKAIGLQSSI